MKISLSFKFRFIVSLLVLFTSLFFSWYFINHTSRIIRESTETRALSLARGLGRACLDGLRLREAQDLERIVEGYLAEEDDLLLVMLF